MSIAILKIKDEEMPVLKKIVKAFTNAKLHVIKNDKNEDRLMSRLIDEGLDSEIISTELFKSELKKHAAPGSGARMEKRHSPQSTVHSKKIIDGGRWTVYC